MDRSDVIQGLLSLYESPEYLEVGVHHGVTFHMLTAARRVAVDPDFRFDLVQARATNPDASYHSIPSDDYFSHVIGADEKFDVIFLDGLHTFEQTLRDLLNAIGHIKPGGAIVIDDVLPNSYAASLPTWEMNIRYRNVRGITDDSWMGDVFRLVYFIRDYLRHFSYATTNEQHGIAILWNTPRPAPSAPLGMNDIMRIDYSDVVLGMDAFNRRPYAEIKAAVRAAIAHHS